jgi:hypothetical protein
MVERQITAIQHLNESKSQYPLFKLIGNELLSLIALMKVKTMFIMLV